MSLSQFPEHDDLWDETDGADAVVDFIIETMALPGERDEGLDLAGHRATLRRCLMEAREAYLLEYWDWLGRTEPEGSEHRPHCNENRNRMDESPFDYKDLRAPADTWRRHWNEFHAKSLSATGERGRNPRAFRIPNSGPRLGKPMLASIYHRVNRWWRAEFDGEPFRPDFTGMVQADADHARLPHINAAARLLVLIAQGVDRRFTIAHCSRVAEEEARFQNSSRDRSAIRKSQREKARRAKHAE